MGIVEGFRVGGESLWVSHLQFVDDTILFLNSDNLNLRNMRMSPNI